MSRRWGSASVRTVLIVILVVGGCCAAAGLATAATTDHDPGWSVEEQSQDGSADNGSTISAQTTSGNVQVVVTASPLAGTYPSDGTIEAAVGVLNASAEPQRPLPGEDVTVTITSPDGDTTTVSGTTDGNGSFLASYDLQNRPDGFYEITVTHGSSDTSSSIEVPVGPSVIGTTGGESVYLDKETTRSFLVRNGTEAVSGMPVTMTVRRGTTVVETKTAESGPNGFVKISFVPEQPASYQIMAKAENATVASPGFGGFLGATDLTAKSLPFSGDGVRRGENASYSGRLMSSSGPVPNTNLDIEFTDFDGNSIVTTEAETDENGFFVADYRIPNDTDVQSTNVDITTDGGAEVASSTGNVFVSDQPSGTTQDVVISTSGDQFQFRAAPGETVTRTFTATDNGSAITNQEIEVVVRYTSGAPVFNGTVVTNDTGQAEVAFEVPDDAIDGTRLSILSAMEYQGQTYRGGSSVSVRALNIQDAATFQPGEASIEVTDATTGDPVAGVPLYFDAQYSQVDSGSFETGGLETDSTGTAQTSYPVPDDVGFYHNKNIVHRYEEARFPTSLLAPYPGELSVSTTTAAPGETVEISLENTGGASAEGIVFGEVDRPEIPYATTISTDANATITVPENASDGARINVNVWAVDADGNRYSDYGFGAITVENDTADTGEAAYANASGVIDNDGLRTAVDDWRTGEIDSGLLRDVVDAWRTGEQVA
jgi:hypothetical protein